MVPNKVGIYSHDDTLRDRLTRECPEWTFVSDDERDRCRVAIVDGNIERSPASRSVVRLVLGAAPADRPHRSGELAFDRDTFLARPGEYLSFAFDLAQAVAHATALELEASYLRQIHDLMTMTDPEDVSERITSTVLGLLGLRTGTLFLHDPRLERYVVSYSNDLSYQQTEEFLPGIPPDLLQQALASPHLFSAARQEDGSGMIVMPLQVGEDLLGVIRVPLGPGDALCDETTAGVTRYLDAVAGVLRNVYQLTRSRDLAMQDDLTKAFNRRFFESYLDEEIERSRRYGSLFSIIFLDLDDLKSINNRYGHLVGSRTLQEVAKRILGAVRGIDKVIRFGGDEFCVVLPQTDEEQAVLVANRIARAMSIAPMTIESDLEVSITASLGIATYPLHAINKDDLIRQADAAMYRVKSTTKNAVGIASVEDATRPVEARARVE